MPTNANRLFQENTLKTSSRSFLTVLLLMTSLVAGCASVPLTSTDQDAKAKSFAVSTGKSSIYLYRNESTAGAIALTVGLGGAIALTVALDGKVAGQTGPETYFLWEVDPGPHEISSISSENTSTLNLNTEPGTAYFIWQEVKMGMNTGRSQLQLVNEETGRKNIAESKRLQSNF